MPYTMTSGPKLRGMHDLVQAMDEAEGRTASCVCGFQGIYGGSFAKATAEVHRVICILGYGT